MRIWIMITGKKGVKGAQPGPALSWMQRVKIALSAAKGLEFLHEKAEPRVVHRDIKSSNIMLFDNDVAKVGDFDVSNQSPDMAARLHSTRVLGTFGYHAPEYAPKHFMFLICYSSSRQFLGWNVLLYDCTYCSILESARYAMTGQLSTKSDVYSFGVVLLELLTGRKPVDHTLPRGQQSLVTWVLIFPSSMKTLSWLLTRWTNNSCTVDCIDNIAGYSKAKWRQGEAMRGSKAWRGLSSQGCCQGKNNLCSRWFLFLSSNTNFNAYWLGCTRF